jgi:hypothetical protein
MFRKNMLSALEFIMQAHNTQYTHMHTHALAHTCTHIHALTHTYIHAHTYARAHTHTPTHTRAHTHTHAHTHTRTQYEQEEQWKATVWAVRGIESRWVPDFSHPLRPVLGPTQPAV